MRRGDRSTNSRAIDRRAFFRYGAVGGVMAVARPALGRGTPVSAPPEKAGQRARAYGLDIQAIAGADHDDVFGRNQRKECVQVRDP